MFCILLLVSLINSGVYKVGLKVGIFTGVVIYKLCMHNDNLKIFFVMPSFQI